MSFLSQAIDCFSFRGFSPAPTAVLYPVLKRLPPGKRIAYLSIGMSAIRTATLVIGRNSPQISKCESAAVQVGVSPLDSDLFAQLPTKTNCGLVIVQIGETDRIDFNQSIRKPTALAELITMARDPRSVVGPDVQPELRYAGLTHPTASYGYLGAVDKALIDNLRDRLGVLKLRPVRIQSSMLSLLSVGLAHPDYVAGKCGLLIVDHGHMLYLKPTQAGQWPAEARLRQNIFEKDDGSRGDFIEQVNRSSSGNLIVLDTNLGGQLSESLYPSANFHPFANVDGEALGIHAALCDSAKPEAAQLLPTVLRGIAHDLGPVPVEMAEVLPGWMRAAAFAFWITLLTTAATLALLSVQQRATSAEAAKIEAELPAIRAEIAQRKTAIATLDRSENLATVLDDWLCTNHGLQPVIVNLLTSMNEKNGVRQLVVSRKAETRSGEYVLTVTFSADQRITNSFITTLSNAVKTSGWGFGHPNLTPSSGTLTLEIPLSQPRISDK
jgi:hypothetical protein